jgi:arginine/lysine/ornithine decarboxylase
VCHGRGLPLIVDEAHGAHLGLHPGLPPSALRGGADLVAQSTHKTGASLTQSAMLHAGAGGRVPPDRVARALQLLQSSSPSYLLLASLDAARAAAQAPGFLDEALAAAAACRAALGALPGLAVVGAGGQRPASAVAFDPLRIAVDVSGWGATGYEAAAALEARHAVVPELATHKARARGRALRTPAGCSGRRAACACPCAPQRPGPPAATAHPFCAT